MSERRRKILLGCGGVVAVSLLGCAGFAGFLTSAAGGVWLKQRLERALNSETMSVSFGEVHTDLWTGARIDDFALSMKGIEVEVGRIDADIDRAALLRGELRIQAATAEGVLVVVQAVEPDPQAPPAAPFSGLGIDLEIAHVDLRGANVSYRAVDGTEIVRVVGGSGTARFVAKGDQIAVEDLDITALLGLSGASAAQVRGTVGVRPAGTFLEHLEVRLPHSELAVDGSITDGLAIDIDADRLSLPDVDQLLGNPGLEGTFEGEARLEGPPDQLRWHADLGGVEGTGGTLIAGGTVDSRAEKLGWTVDATLEGIDANQLYPGIGNEVLVTGRAVVDGKGTAWPDDLTMTITWDGTRHRAFGQKVDAAHASVSIEQGRVRLENTTLDGILGGLNVEGLVDTVAGPMDLRVYGSIQPQRLREMDVTGIDAPGWLDARIEGDLSDPDAPIRVIGTATFAPFRSGETLAFERVFASYAVTVLGEDIRGTAVAEATGGNVGGITIARADVPDIAFRQGPGGLAVSGGLHAERVDLPKAFGARSLYGTWSLDGGVTAADITLVDPSLLGREASGGRVAIRQQGDRIDLEARMIGETHTLIDVAGFFDSRRSQVELDRFDFAPTARASWSAPRPVRLTLTEGGVTDADVLLVGSPGTVELTGTLGTQGPLDGVLSIRGLDLEAIADLDPGSMPGLSGTLDMELVLSGEAQRPEISGTLAAKALHWSDQVRDLDLSGTFGADPRQATTELRIGSEDALLARLVGSIPVRLDLADPRLDPDGPVDLTLALTPGPLGRLADVFPAATDIPPGVASMVVEVGGRLADPDLRLAGIVEAEIKGWDDPARIEFDLGRKDGALSGWGDLRHRHQAVAQTFTVGRVRLEEILRPLIVDGVTPEGLLPSSLIDDLLVSGVLLEIPAEKLASAAGQNDLWVRGKITGGFQVSGRPERPSLDASLSWVDGKIGRQGIEALDLQFLHAEGGYDVHLDLDFRQDGRFELEGHIPVVVDLTRDTSEWTTGEISLRFGGPGVPLRTVTAWNRSVTQVEGLLRLEGDVTGSLFDPRPHYTLKMDGGAATIEDLGIRLQNVALDLSGDREHVQLHDLSGTSRPEKGRFDLQEGLEQVGRVVEEIDPDAQLRPDSSFKGSGELTLVDNAIGSVKGRMRLDNGTWLMHTADKRIQLDGKLRVAGDWPRLAVGGDLTVRDALVRLDAAAFVDRAPIEPDARITIVRPGGMRVIDDDEAPPWYQDMVASVELDLKRSVELDVSMPFVDDFGSLGAFVSRADLFARLGGTAQLTLAEGVPSMVGELELADGRLKMLSRRFDVDRGKIQFTGGDIAEPLLDIRASTTLANIPITATVAGTPSSPGITTECEGIASQSDCLMVLITGRNPEDEDGEGGPGAGAALAGMALGGLLGQQDVADLSIEPDGTLQVGAALTNSVYFTYTFNPAPDIGENANTGEFDVGLARRLVWNLGIGDTKSWTDVFWELRF